MHTLYNHSPVRHVLAARHQSNPPLPAADEAGHILFMDDDENIRALTQRLLESLGYHCDLAKNGEETLQLYQQRIESGRAYDAVIMDLTVVGGMGGEQTFKQLRELDPRVRAVVTSGYDNEELRRHLLDLGICGYLPKPYRVGELGRLLKTVAA